MPKQITQVDSGGCSRITNGKCAIIAVNGVSDVMPTPFTSKWRFIPSP